MKNAITLALVLFLGTVVSNAQQVSEIEVESKIKEVTVFFQGAQIVRESSFSGQSGKKYLIKVQDVETGMVRSSLQVKAPEGISIDQINHQVKFVETENHDPEIKTLKEKLEALRIELQQKNDQVELIGVQRAMLNENRGLSKSQSGMTVEEWKSGVAYYEQKTTELIQRQRENERAAIIVQGKMQKLLERLDEITNIAQKQTIEVLIEATCTKSVNNGAFRFSFLIPDATWNPKYDLKMDGLDKPLVLDVKADITQWSGNDWKNIDLLLTSEDPFKSAEKPTLRKWDPVRGYRPKSVRIDKSVKFTGNGSVSGQVLDRESFEPLFAANVELINNGQTIMGVATDFDGKFELSKVPSGTGYQLRVSYLGYNKEKREEITVYKDQTTKFDIRMAPAAALLESVVVSAGKYELTARAEEQKRAERAEAARYKAEAEMAAKEAEERRYMNEFDKIKREEYTSTTITKGATRVLYKLKEKFSIASDNKPHTAPIDKLVIDANLEHFTAPVEFDKAFLVSQITGWESFNLLDGIVSLHVDGSYVGESALNSEQVEDTLTLSLGTDASIQIDRSEVKENKKRNVLSGKKTVQKSYKIKIKNTRSEAIKITVQDQIPVSSDKEVEVELVESGEAKLDKDTGILEWEVEIPAGQSWETTFTFSVKYPNYRGVYID